MKLLHLSNQITKQMCDIYQVNSTKEMSSFH